MNKQCLNCKYEPEWSEESKGAYPTRTGKCKYVIPGLILPAVSRIDTKIIIRYSDDSGLPQSKCRVFESKDI